jgi:formyl-CoA transferase
VIKVESPDGGDPLRKWRKLYEGTSLWWYVQARNKKSVAANLKHPEGREFVRRLIADADILVENFRPGVLEKLGLSLGKLKADNPGLVMVRLSGFGQTGPYKDQPGFGAVGESMGGLRYITGEPDRPPVRTGISIGDSIAALWGAIGALMALRHKEVNGGSRAGRRRRALRGGVRHDGIAGPGIRRLRLRPRAHRQHHARHHAVEHAHHEGRQARDHRRQWRCNLQAFHACHRPRRSGRRPDAGRQRRPRRPARRNLRPDRPLVAEHDEAEVLALLSAAEVPSSRVYSAVDMFADPQFIARQMFESARLPDGKEFRLPGIVPKLSETPGGTEWIGPALGEHTDAVLTELGYAAERIAALRADGAI